MIEELLEALLKGGQAPGGAARPSADAPDPNNPWISILGAVLGGAAGNKQQPTGDSGGGLDLSRLLEIFLGGGDQGSVAANPALAPFVEALSEKLGLSPQLAATIVSYAFSLIVATLKGNAQPGATSQDGQAAPNLDHLLDGDFLERSGLAAQLASNTGLDPTTARESLRTALAMLSTGSVPEAQPVQQPSSGSSKLQHLLDEW